SSTPSRAPQTVSGRRALGDPVLGAGRRYNCRRVGGFAGCQVSGLPRPLFGVRPIWKPAPTRTLPPVWVEAPPPAAAPLPPPIRPRAARHRERGARDRTIPPRY